MYMDHPHDQIRMSLEYPPSISTVRGVQNEPPARLTKLNDIVNNQTLVRRAPVRGHEWLACRTCSDVYRTLYSSQSDSGGYQVVGFTESIVLHFQKKDNDVEVLITH